MSTNKEAGVSISTQCGRKKTGEDQLCLAYMLPYICD